MNRFHFKRSIRIALIAICTVVVSVVFYNFSRFGIIYTHETAVMVPNLLIRIAVSAIPIFLSMWILNDTAKKNIRHGWLWVLGNLLAPIIVIPIYLLYRRRFKNRSVLSGAAVTAKNLGLLMVLFFISTFISTTIFLAMVPRVLTGRNMNIFQFISEANKERARYTIKPPFTSTTYLGKPYALQHCYGQIPQGFRYYAKHVHGWNVYIPSNTPIIQGSREPFDEILLESPKRWICRYLYGEESSINWNTYTNQRYHYSVFYPPYWALNERNTQTVTIHPDVLKAGRFPYKQDYGLQIETAESPLSIQQLAEQKYRAITGKEKPKNGLGILYPSGWMWTIFEDGKNDQFSYDFGIRLAVLKKGNTAYIFLLGPYTPDDVDYDETLSSTYTRILEKFVIN